MLNRDGTIEAEVLNNRANLFNANPIEQTDNNYSFGDKSLFQRLAIEKAMVNAVGIAFGNFITEHIKENLAVSNPLIAEVDLHLETNTYRGVFEVGLTEDSQINLHHTEQDKMIMMRSFYHFDEFFREYNGLRQVPTEEKQRKYDEHISGLHVPYMRAANVPNLEDRKPDETIEFVEITEQDEENLQGKRSKASIQRQQEVKALEEGRLQIETLKPRNFFRKIKNKELKKLE